MKPFSTFLALAVAFAILTEVAAIARPSRHAASLDDHGTNIIIIITPRNNQTMQETAEELRRDSKLTTGESLTKRAPGRIPSAEKLAGAIQRGRTLIQYMQDPNTVPDKLRTSP